MSRSIVYEASPLPPGVTADPPGPPAPDTWKDKVIKLIPVEVLSFYIAVHGIIQAATPAPGTEDNRPLLMLIVFVAGLIGTPLYLAQATKTDPTKPSTKQYVITTIAFIVWALATTDPLVRLMIPLPGVVKSLLLPVFTFAVGWL